MDSTAPKQSEAELTQQVAETLIRLRRETAIRDRWFWLGCGVQVYRSLMILAVIAGLFGFIRVFMASSPPKGVVAEPLGLEVARVLLGVAGAVLSIVIATWAIRYCDARANG